MGEIKKIIKTVLLEISLFRNISKKYGHLNSVRSNMPLDENNNPIPWYTYPAIEYLDQFDYTEKNVFEWGMGSSTLYWGKKAKQVISVEDDEIWFNNINRLKSSNSRTLLLRNKEEYVNSIASFKTKFDVVVIDAKFREDCIKLVPYFLNSGGIFIFDNSDRYPNLLKKIRKTTDLLQVDFHGFGPITSFSWTTTIFFDKAYAFKVKGRQPVYS